MMPQLTCDEARSPASQKTTASTNPADDKDETKTNTSCSSIESFDSIFTCMESLATIPLSVGKIAPLNVSERLARRNASSFLSRGPSFRYQRKCLTHLGFTPALFSAVRSTRREIPLRIWIIDNSESMTSNDGSRVVGGEYDFRFPVKVEKCSRWEELSSTIRYHVHLASVAETPTIFRLLNRPDASHSDQQFSVAEEKEFLARDEDRARMIIDSTTPGGYPATHRTTVVEHLQHICHQIRHNELVADLEPGQEISVTIATDRLPDDREGLINALGSLQELPIRVVFRLVGEHGGRHSKQRKTVDNFFEDWNSRRKNAPHQRVDVVHEYMQEARRITRANPFVNYTLPLHRLREFGSRSNALRLLADCKPMLPKEILEYSQFVVGLPVVSSGSKKAMRRSYRQLQDGRSRHCCHDRWNVLKGRTTPLILSHKLPRATPRMLPRSLRSTLSKSKKLGIFSGTSWHIR